VKFVWICLATLCALASLCGAGLYLWGSSFYRHTESLDREAAAYSENVARQVCSEWRADTLRAAVDAADSKMDPAKVVMDGRLLGTVVSMPAFKPVQSVWRAESEGRRQVVTSISNTTFSHGSATIVVRATKLDAGWRVVTFELGTGTATRP
jgi:hypothetical protein